MKHIKKKFLLSLKLEKDAQEYLKTIESDKKVIDNIVKQDFKDYVPHVITEDGSFIQTFKYKRNNKTLFVPEPNPIVIYFSNSQVFLKSLNDSRDELFGDLTKNNDVGNVLNSSYRFFGFASNFVTSLFNALEAFINSQIPNDFEYKKVDKKSTEIFNKEQIQRYIQFDEKIKKVVPQITNKSFHRHYSHKFEILKKFKDLRDKVVHTKADQKTTPNYYQNLFTELLDFDYNQTILTTKEYINYYQENLIEKCDCGQDY
ncbi:hypothetical protein [Algibacter lectus]|uniref:hypothetical protein n=1 Tax=Algibacter lectus TaxID=221126 RepID=UPI00249500DF|nr:hypothetical protein [Algibacter lectus]